MKVMKKYHIYGLWSGVWLAMMIHAGQILGQSASGIVRPSSVLEYQFMKQKPTDRELRAFEERAMEKWQDFVNYLEIMGNPEYDQSLRDHAASLARELFLSPDYELGALGTVEKFIQRRLSINTPDGFIQVSDIQVVKGFKMTGKNMAAGVIGFHLSVADKIPQEFLLPVTLLKKKKNFGDDMIEVWEVFLGEN